MTEYNPKSQENKWKQLWYDNNIYKAQDTSDKKKKYILAELPYPSGHFLHVGHMMRYTVPEIFSRFWRMNGYNVLFPMGWDAFGLPAETFAIKNNITPQEAIKKASTTFKESMMSMGYAIDWDREITTSDPNYYKWTQWIFLQLYEMGLVVQKEMPAWWCKELGVLADEEVLPDPEGPTGKKSERGDHPVQRKMLKQWVLTIPDYADKLLEGLEDVDYPESIKSAQINWIGKKQGAEIYYPVDKTDDVIVCFTTRPDTNYGATFIVVSPEHEFTQKILNNDIKAKSEDLEKIKEYVNNSLAKTELERQSEGRNKTGVFTGYYATNRLSGKQLPVWISDFVLPHFGTGAVVGVPGHDKRDFEFAKQFDLEIICVVSETGEEKTISTIEDVFEDPGINVNSQILDGLKTTEAISKITDYLEEKKWGKKRTTYKLRDQIWSRQRYWGDPIPLKYKDDQTVEIEANLPVQLPEITKEIAEQAKINKEFPPLDNYKTWAQTTANDGSPATRETDTMPTWAGSNWYYLRYIDPKNNKEFADQEKLKYWLPVDHYFGGGEHTTVHLLYSRFWHRALYDKGLLPTKEPYQRRLNGGLMLGPDGRKMSKRLGNVINPQEVVEQYGADATRTYIAFIGPYEDTYPWNENGLQACFKLMVTIYKLRLKATTKPNDSDEQAETEKKYHQLVQKTTQMLGDLKMNTAVSEIMIFTNHLKTVSQIDMQIWKGFIKVIAPFAPFLAETLWQEANNYNTWTTKNSVHLQSWPEFDESKAKENIITLPIQINGKMKDTIEVKRDMDKESISSLVLQNKKIKKLIGTKKIIKTIYVPNKILNIVITK